MNTITNTLRKMKMEINEYENIKLNVRINSVNRYIICRAWAQNPLNICDFNVVPQQDNNQKTIIISKRKFMPAGAIAQRAR